MFIYEIVNQAFLMWFTPIRGNNIPVSGPFFLEELVNLLTHLIATLSRHQTDGLEDGKRGSTRLLLYTFLYSQKYCYDLIRRNIVNN